MTETRTCEGCGNALPDNLNQCSWACSVAIAQASGGKVIAPNDLPIVCIRADGTMLEHEHADHPNYLFPVVAEFVGTRIPLPAWDPSYEPETHALIWADDGVCLTLYECTYHLWSRRSGACLGDSHYVRGTWALSEASRAKIDWRLRDGEEPGKVSAALFPEDE